MSEKLNATKVTLSTKKVVILKEMKIKDQRIATKMLGQGKMNNAEMGVRLQENLLKVLVLEVDGKALTHDEKEDLDNLFTPKEYGQLIRVLEKLNSDEEDGSTGEPEIEMLTT